MIARTPAAIAQVRHRFRTVFRKGLLIECSPVSLLPLQLLIDSVSDSKGPQAMLEERDHTVLICLDSDVTRPDRHPDGDVEKLESLVVSWKLKT